MKHRKPYQIALTLAGLGMIAGAVFHVACLIGGPDWVAFAGAPNWAVESVREGTWVGFVGTLLITTLLIFWALYAFSAASIFRKLPLLKSTLGITAFILIVRGLIFLPLLPRWKWNEPLYIFHGALSFFVLFLGLAFAFGLYGFIKDQPHK